jgi:hypothetical protein
MSSMTVNVTSANLRDAPSEDAPVAAVLEQGAAVDPLSNNDDNTWFFVSSSVGGGTRMGWIRADLVGPVGPPAPEIPAGGPDTTGPDAEPKPVGDPKPFTTKPSESGDSNGSSSTSGLNGTQQAFDDGSTVIEATEELSATRVGPSGFSKSLAASCHRVTKDDVMTIEQTNYCYRPRKLPDATFFLKSTGIPSDVPAGFRATPVRVVIASQFGKNDRDDEGTGTPAMCFVQTNSEIAGGSIKISKMVENFGANWDKNPQRLVTLIEVHSNKTGRRVRVPLVDVGPGEGILAEVDLTWACDQFLGTQGHGEVSYRLLIPV